MMQKLFRRNTGRDNPGSPLFLSKLRPSKAQHKAGNKDPNPKVLVCPCSHRAQLQFRRISSRGAAICYICGCTFNGIVVRCGEHDFNVCGSCHDAFYYFPQLDDIFHANGDAGVLGTTSKGSFRLGARNKDPISKVTSSEAQVSPTSEEETENHVEDNKVKSIHKSKAKTKGKTKASDDSSAKQTDDNPAKISGDKPTKKSKDNPTKKSKDKSAKKSKDNTTKKSKDKKANAKKAIKSNPDNKTKPSNSPIATSADDGSKPGEKTPTKRKPKTKPNDPKSEKASGRGPAQTQSVKSPASSKRKSLLRRMSFRAPMPEESDQVDVNQMVSTRLLKRYTGVTDRERTIKAFMQALGYAIWYKPQFTKLLLDALVANPTMKPTDKTDLLDTLLCLCCIEDPRGHFDAHILTVKLILDTEFANPAVCHSMPLGLAARAGHVQIVRALLDTGDTDPSADKNYALRFAAMRGHTEVVDILLQDPRVNPASKQSYALRIACKKGYTDIVALLLKSPQVRPQALENTAIALAAKGGFREIVQMLVEDDRVDPHDHEDFALEEAILHNRKACAELLCTPENISGAVTFSEKNLVTKAMRHFLIKIENKIEVLD